MEYSSSCSCGKTRVTLTLPQSIEEYTPRACDCDFCSKRKASYISDPNGVFEITRTQNIEQLLQGSKQATFWQCKDCDNLIAVTYESEKGLQGAVNASLFTEKYNIQEPISVSPKTLSPDEKRERWTAAWMQVQLGE